MIRRSGAYLPRAVLVAALCAGLPAFGPACAFLGIPGSREYSAAQARAVLDDALVESLLIASLSGSPDEAAPARLIQNLLIQGRVFESTVPIETGKVYLRDDVHDCADRLRSIGLGIGVALSPEGVVLGARGCDVPAR